MQSLTLQCPCKINLTLQIAGQLPSGYHRMHMVMQAIDLCDTVTLTVGEGQGIHLTSSDADLPADDPHNIACRCAKALLEDAGLQADASIAIHLQKRIPMQAGLGGGSADGAGVLVGLNQLLQLNYTSERLCQIGACIGADIPFCIHGGTALVTGFGEEVSPITPLPDCHVVLAKPQKGVSTAACFSAFDQSSASKQLAVDMAMEQALKENTLSAVSAALYNVLEPYAGLEEIPYLKQILVREGALGSLMSGSGSAVFGLFDDFEKARSCMQKIQREGFFAATAKPLSHGPWSIPTP